MNLANNLSLNSTSSNAGIFECPVCKQTIDSSSTKCRFCSATIDPAAAEIAAEKMAKVNQACSDASFLRTMAIAILGFLGLMFLPILNMLGSLGYDFLVFAVPFMTIRWWVKFGAIHVDDRDFKRAKGTVIVVTILGSFPLLFLIASVSTERPVSGAYPMAGNRCL
jgi:hypothetical protein